MHRPPVRAFAHRFCDVKSLDLCNIFSYLKIYYSKGARGGLVGRNTMENIFDTHAHYDDNAFSEDSLEILETLKKNGVCNVINVGADMESSKSSVELSQKYDFLYAAVGVHPYSADKLPSKYLDTLEKWSKLPKTVAIGEIGLDYHTENCQKEFQIKVFKEQLELAKSVGLPVIIHSRDAHADTLDILKKYRPKGVVHCFSGSKELADEIIKLGMYIGLGGVVTFKNAKKAQEVARSISLENLVLETDAPYMAPEPFRGKRCDSTLIKYTALKIAELKNIDVNYLLSKTKENAETLFFSGKCC